jgi:hypothetical protein
MKTLRSALSDRRLRAVASVFVSVLSLAWIVLAGSTLLSLALYAVFLVAVVIPRVRRRVAIPITVLGLSLAACWSPVDVTLLNVDGPPKLVKCCPGTPYRDYRAVLERQAKGECKFCSDLVGFIEPPTWFLVW